MSLRCLRATLIALLALGVGCAQDFDGLFAKGNPPVTDSGPNPGADAAGGDSGTMSCGTNTACVYSGDVMCSAIGNACNFDCRSPRCSASCNATSCTLTCEPGTVLDSGTPTCSLNCNNSGPGVQCVINCPGGSQPFRCPIPGGGTEVSCSPCDN